MSGFLTGVAVTVSAPFIAKFRGRCEACRGAIRGGEEIVEVGSKRYAHAECAPEPDAEGEDEER